MQSRLVRERSKRQCGGVRREMKLRRRERVQRRSLWCLLATSSYDKPKDIRGKIRGHLTPYSLFPLLFLEGQGSGNSHHDGLLG